jgi:hypothetical protein
MSGLLISLIHIGDGHCDRCVGWGEVAVCGNGCGMGPTRKLEEGPMGSKQGLERMVPRSL